MRPAVSYSLILALLWAAAGRVLLGSGALAAIGILVMYFIQRAL